MTHTRIYHGNDSEFTEALASYYHFRDDARFGGWQNYLQRSDDFIRFCCHMHIAEMLSARGGAGETRVVWQLVGLPIKTRQSRRLRVLAEYGCPAGLNDRLEPPTQLPSAPSN